MSRFSLISHPATHARCTNAEIVVVVLNDVNSHDWSEFVLFAKY